MANEEKAIIALQEDVEEQDDYLVAIRMELAELQVRFAKLETYIFDTEKIKT